MIKEAIYLSPKKKLIKGCCERFPTFRVSSCPQGPQVTPELSEKSGVDVFFIVESETVPISTLTLTLPPITILQGQIVELDGFATAIMRSNSAGTNYGGFLDIVLYRDIVSIANSFDGVGAIPKTVGEVQEVHLNPSIMWVDSPPPGTYVYSLTINTASINIDNSESEIFARSLIAKVYKTV